MKIYGGGGGGKGEIREVGQQLACGHDFKIASNDRQQENNWQKRNS